MHKAWRVDGTFYGCEVPSPRGPVRFILNKSDIFAEMVPQYDVGAVEAFKDYKGGADYDAAD